LFISSFHIGLVQECSLMAIKIILAYAFKTFHIKLSCLQVFCSWSCFIDFNQA